MRSRRPSGCVRELTGSRRRIGLRTPSGQSGKGSDATGPLSPIILTVREIGAFAQLRDRHLESAGAGVELAVPVAVAHVGALRRGLAVRSAADRVRLRGHQGV